MGLNTLVVSLTTITFVTIVTGAISILVWFLIRKRRHRVWLPILRIMELDNRKLPVLKIILPPWVSFLAFLLSLLALVFFSLRPTKEVYDSSQPAPNITHIFVDMSPSVSAVVNEKQLVEKVVNLVNSIKSSGKVTLSTSHSKAIINVEEEQNLSDFLINLGLHRAGVKLGKSLRAISSHFNEIDRLLIVSDFDESSWSDLHWSNLSKEIEIFYLPLASPIEKPKRNVFINGATNISNLASTRMEWEVEVARTSDYGTDSGSLEVLVGAHQLSRVHWQIPPGKNNIRVEVNWPLERHQENQKGQESKSHLTWRIAVDGENSIKMDDLFHTESSWVRQDILVIAAPSGERFLEDSAYHLKTVLESLGFKVKRLDSVPDAESVFLNYPLWIVVAGNGEKNGVCPDLKILKRIDSLGKVNDMPEKKSPVIWLAPSDLFSDFHDTCSCFRQLNFQIGDDDKTDYCRDISTRDQWIGVLSSVGAKQIGGELGEVLGSIAWHIKTPRLDQEILAFTLPLHPVKESGLNFVALPLVVKTLLDWQGFLEGGKSIQPDRWPRIDDIASTFNPSGETDSMKVSRLSNVPLGESLLVQSSIKDLPPIWSYDEIRSAENIYSKKKKDDSLPWVIVCCSIIMLAIFWEGSWKMVAYLIKVTRKRNEALLFFILLFASDRLEAKVKLTLLGYSDQENTSHFIAKEVISRTSINLDQEVIQYNKLEDETFKSPWIWAKSPDLLSTADAKLDKRVESWLKRGGFLIVENVKNELEIDKLFKNVNLREDEGWKSIPPDHELMRSFHLLDSLIACPGQIWKGFHYDGRLLVLAIPYSFLETLLDIRKTVSCLRGRGSEDQVRIFINILMVALTTDYKKDQIHLPDILKRLR